MIKSWIAARMLPDEPVLPTTALLNAAGLHPRFRAAAKRLTAIPTAEGASDSEQLLRNEFVPSNCPALLRSALQDWAPVLSWSDDDYLRSAAPDSKVSARRVDLQTGGCVASGSYESDEISWPAPSHRCSAPSARSGATLRRPTLVAALELRCTLTFSKISFEILKSLVLKIILHHPQI